MLYRSTDKTEATEIVIIDSQMNYRGKLDTYAAKRPPKNILDIMNPVHYNSHNLRKANR